MLTAEKIKSTMSRLHTLESGARTILQLIVDAKCSVREGDKGSAEMDLEQAIEDCGTLAKQIDETMAEM